MTYSYRALTHDDVDAWADLTVHLADVDATGESYERDDLVDWLDGHNFQPETDSRGAFDDAGRLVAVSLLSIGENLLDGVGRVFIEGGVHHDHRNRGIGTELFDWSEASARARIAERFPGVGVRFSVPGGLEGSSLSELLEGRGYTVARWFIDMKTQLADWEDPGTSTRATTFTMDDAAATLDAHRAAFQDHWSYSGTTDATWQENLIQRASRLDQSAVVVDESGRVLSYAMSGEWEPGSLYVTLVGTRAEARGQGLAADVLRHVLRSAKAAGMREVELTVDAASPTSANRVYERVGFAPVRSISRYERLDPAS